jgi:hypothetical protein
MEEAQHAKLDTLLVAELGKENRRRQIQTALDGYLESVCSLTTD